MGIPLEVEAAIFRPFEQGSRGLEVGGTGLGLTIAQHLLRLMSSELLLESPPGRGARFHFGLILRSAQETQPIPPVSTFLASLPRLLPGTVVSVLVADDQPANRDLNLLGSILVFFFAYSAPLRG